MNLDELQKIAESATPGPWNYEDERYSAKCVIGIKPRDDRWIANFQPEFNGECNGLFLAAFNPQTALKLIADLRKAIAALDHFRLDNNCCDLAMAGDYLADHLIEKCDECLASLSHYIKGGG